MVANIVEDYRMLEVARDEAELIQSGEFFTEKYERLRAFINDHLLNMSFD